MMAPRVAICVVTFNSASLLEELVASLDRGAEGVRSTVVFSDNASSDDTLAEIERLAPHATVVRNGGNLGYAAGVNAAVRAAGAQDAYLILNADVRLDPGCVATLFGALSDTVGVVVPRLRDADGRLILSLRRAPSVLRAWGDALLGAERAGRFRSLGEMVVDEREYADAHEVDWAEGSTQLIGSDCWEASGGWDESFFLYSEETEYDLRIRQTGRVTWFEPRASAQHLEGGSAGNVQQWSLLVANRIKLFGAGHGRVSTAAFWAGVFVREASRSILGKPTSRAALRVLLRPSRLRQPRNPQWLADVSG